MARSLITGSRGFIGKHLTKELEQLGHIVVPINHQQLYAPDYLKGFLEMAKPDYIFHLAAYGNMSHHTEEEEIFKANVIGTWNLISASNHIKYKGFVFVSTSSVTLPIQTLYSTTKKAAEEFVRFYGKIKPIVAIRPYSVYGPGEADYRFIPTVIRCIEKGEILHLDPMPVHDWVYVEDVVNELITYAKNAENLKGGIGEFGTCISTSNGEVVKILENIAGKKVMNRVLKYGQRVYDSMEWAAKSTGKTIPLEKGLKKTYEYYKSRT